MIVRDKGRVFATLMPIKTGVWPLADTMWANQTEPPYRLGFGIVVRVWLATGLAIGVWGPGREATLEEAIGEGLKGRFKDAGNYRRPEFKTWRPVSMSNLAVLMCLLAFTVALLP